MDQPMAANAKGVKDVVISVGVGDRSGGEEMANPRSNCKMEVVIEQFFTGPALAEMLCKLSFGALLGIPATNYNKILPVGYFVALILLLFLGFIALLLAICLRKAFHNIAGVLVLFGTTFVVSALFIVIAAVLPPHLLFLSVFVNLFLIFFILLVLLWLHFHLVKAIKVETSLSVPSEEVASSRIPSFSPNEQENNNELKLGSGDVEEKPNLVLKKEEISKTVPVWIQLHGLDIKFWGRDCLNKIAGLVGKPVRRDRVTTYKQKIRYARILVEVELNSPLPNFIYFEDEGGCRIAQKVAYELKPYFCDYCQNFGHEVTDECRRRGPAAKKIWVVKS